MQSPLFSQEGVAELRSLGGASSGHLVDWLNHGYFAIKEFTAAKPYTLISEWLCADIASWLGLPIPGRQTVPYNGQCLGFEWRDESKGFMPGMESRLMNPDAIFGMLAFDILVCNRDRHSQNILFQRPSPGVANYSLQLIDHSHALIGELADFAALEKFIGSNPDPDAFLRKVPVQLRALVNDLADFDPWINKIENLPLAVLKDSVAQIPSSWKPNPDETGRVIDFVDSRKEAIRPLLQSGKDQFPNVPK